MPNVMSVMMRKWVEDNWGERCPEYQEGCAICEAWKAYDYLFELEKASE